MLGFMAINSCMPLISVEAGFSHSFSTSTYYWKLLLFFFFCFLTQQRKSQHRRDSFSNFSFNSKLLPLFSRPHVIYSSVPDKKDVYEPFSLHNNTFSSGLKKKKRPSSAIVFISLCVRGNQG